MDKAVECLKDCIARSNDEFGCNMAQAGICMKENGFVFPGGLKTWILGRGIFEVDLSIHIVFPQASSPVWINTADEKSHNCFDIQVSGNRVRMIHVEKEVPVPAPTTAGFNSHAAEEVLECKLIAFLRDRGNVAHLGSGVGTYLKNDLGVNASVSNHHSKDWTCYCMA